MQPQYTVLPSTYYLPFESGDGTDHKPFPAEFLRLPGAEFFTEKIDEDGQARYVGNPQKFAEYLDANDYVLLFVNTGATHIYQVYDHFRKPLYPYASFSTSDTAFWTMAGIMKSVVTAGVGAWAEAGSAVASGASIASNLEGANMDFDIDFGSIATDTVDYSNAFNPFDFTSGERLQVFSDAQNVDFGFGAGSGDFGTSFDWSLQPDQGYNFDLSNVFNGTPEIGVSDFGTWWSNPALEPVKSDAIKQVGGKLIGAAIAPAKPGPAPSQLPNPVKSVTNGVQDLVGAAMSIIRVRDAYSGTATQRETEQAKTYKGQLAPRPSTVQAPVSPWVLVGAGALVLGGLIYVSRKG